ncbi:MAG: glycosyltransferase family 4 protein [Thermoplasmata archaeon]
MQVYKGAFDKGLKRLLGYFKNLAVISSYKKCPRLVAESKRSCDYLTRLGLSRDKIVVLPHGADIEKYKPREKDRSMLSRMQISQDAVVINYMGEFSEYKGGEYIAECALSKSFEDRNVIFIFPNFGELYSRYSARLGNCKHVRIRGKMSEGEIIALYSISDITVVPSKLMHGDSSDRSPNALIEGMCCGNAVIGTDVGGIPDIMGDAGILVEPNNVKALEDAILKLITDKGLLERYKRVARKQAEEKLDNRKYARKIFSLFEEVKP